MTHSKFKVLYYYRNIHLWKNKSITKLHTKKWNALKIKNTRNIFNKRHEYFFRGKYICHYKKLKIERLYYFKFVNKQVLRKYLVNYKDYNFKNTLKSSFYNFERRLDFNLYQANFVNSLYEARFVITKGYILVNNTKVTTFNYLLNSNDLVEVNKKFFDKALINLNFSNFENKKYKRNLEIDYKTFSFIFLNNPNYFIFNYNNFIKKVYIRRYNLNKKRILSNNIFSYNTKIFNLRNKYNFNNYYNFFQYILIYYIFLDKKNKIFKYKNLHYNTNYPMIIL